MHAQVKQLPAVPTPRRHPGGVSKDVGTGSQVRETAREQTEESNPAAPPQARKGKSEEDTTRKRRGRKHSRDETNKGNTKRGGITKRYLRDSGGFC